MIPLCNSVHEFLLAYSFVRLGHWSQSPFYSHVRYGARNMEDTDWQMESQPNLTNHIQSKALGTHEHKHSRKQGQTEKRKGKLQHNILKKSNWTVSIFQLLTKME